MYQSITDNVLLVVILLWSIFWKCYSVWIAVKNNDKRWFIALLILNTVGILDIIYIFSVAKKNTGDIKNVLKRSFRLK